MPFFRDSSIRRKLSMVIFCTSLLGLSLTGVAFEFYERASFRSSLVNQLTSHADMLSLNTAASLTFNDRKSAEDMLKALRVSGISSRPACTTLTKRVRRISARGH